MSDTKYFNFPIQLLSGFMVDSKAVLNKISDYAVYEKALNLSSDKPQDFISEAAEYFNISLASNNTTFKNGKDLYKRFNFNIESQRKSPKVGINLSIFWDFYNNNKPDFDKISLLSFLAVKSMLHGKACIKMTNAYLLCRMDGLTSTKVGLMELSDSILDYLPGHKIRKIKKHLKYDWNVKMYGEGVRGCWVSISMDLDSLVLHAMSKSKATKEKQYKKELAEAKIRALNKMNEATIKQPIIKKLRFVSQPINIEQSSSGTRASNL